MSNIKWSYWVPCLGVAFIWNDPESFLNIRQERVLVIYHGLVTCLLIAAGMALLVQIHPAVR